MITTTQIFFSMLIFSLSVSGKSKYPFKWKSLDSVQDMDTAFGEQESSFDVKKNWEICSSVVTDIPYSSDVADYAPIINQELAALKKKGGAIRLAKGVYNVSSTIELPSRTCLVGDGTENTVLRVTNRAPAFKGKGVLYSKKGEYVSIMTLTVDGNKDNQSEGEAFARTGVYFELVNYAWFRGVASINHIRHGYNLHGSDGRHLFHAFIQNCSAENNNWAGFKLGSTKAASIVNSVAKENGRAGIAVTTGATTTMLKDNRLWKNGFRGRGCGVHVFEEKGLLPTDTLILSNEIFDSTHAGVCLNTTNEVRAVKNMIENMQSDKAYCYDLFDARALSIVETTCDVMSGVEYYPGPPDIAKATHSASYSPSLSPTRSVSPSPSTSATISPTPWPSVGYGCYEGIANFNVCCRSECEECASPDCVGDCCPNVIIRNGRSCATNGPPCVLGMSIPQIVA